MTREGTLYCISLLKLNYPNWMKEASMNEGEALSKLWLVSFKNIDDELVVNAVMDFISTSKYQPTIADIKSKILDNATSKMNESDVWDIVLNACKNSGYHANDEWNKLPEDIKEITTPSLLYEISQSSVDSHPFFRRDIINSYNNNYKLKRERILTSNNLLDVVNNKKLEMKEETNNGISKN